jgi:LysR family transcriptional regulator, glycine cleavage system transcriptional activator
VKLACRRVRTTDDWPAWFELASPTPVKLPGGPRFEHCNLTLGAAEQGQGVALAFLALAQSALAAGTLVRVFDAQTLPKAIYSIVFPTEWKSYGKVAAFRDWLMDQVEVWVAAMPGVESAPTHQPVCSHATPTFSAVDLAAQEKMHTFQRHRPDRL